MCVAHVNARFTWQGICSSTIITNASYSAKVHTGYILSYLWSRVCIEGKGTRVRSRSVPNATDCVCQRCTLWRCSSRQRGRTSSGTSESSACPLYSGWCGPVALQRDYCALLSFHAQTAVFVQAEKARIGLIAAGLAGLRRGGLCFPCAHARVVVVAVDFFGPPAAMAAPRKWRVAIPINLEHVTERFGLFSIIILGETVVSTLFVESGTFR